MNLTARLPRPHVALLAAIVAACLCFFTLSGCAAQGQAPIVGFATVLGDGDARVDMNGRAVVLGQVQGEVGLFMTGSGFPLTVPLHSVKGAWRTRDVEGNWKSGNIATDPMPYWIVELYRPNELARIAAHLGYSEILVEPQPFDEPPQPVDVQPTT